MRSRPCITPLVRFPRIASLLLAACSFTLTGTLPAEVLREQTISIQPGWNAVHLEVTPLETKPAKVFEDLPIDIVARFFQPTSPVQFISDPSEEPWKGEGWGVWYAPSRQDAFLSNLHAINGNRCYLVHATEAVEWKVTGKVRHSRLRWRHNSYNLVGLTVDPTSPPTFESYFAAAKGKIGQKIYRLQEGKWIKIINPAATKMRSGEAVWTWCDGLTDFQGPLDLKFGASGSLDFGTLSHTLKVQWHSAHNSKIAVEVVNPKGTETNVPALPVHTVEKDYTTLRDSYPALTSKTLAEADGPRAGLFALHLRREKMTASQQGALLKFSDGSGAVQWVPVAASRPAK